MDLIRLTETKERPKAPPPDQVELHFSDKAVKELEALLKHYPEKKAALLPALWIAQREYGGYLPPNALAEVALRLERSYAEVEGVATFYTMYHVGHPVGRHLIEVCTCLSCYLCGAYRLADKLKERLGIDWGETTPDGLFTLEEVECLDACDRAPVLQIGDQYLGPVNESMVDSLIAELKEKTESSTVKLSDEIVKTLLRKDEIDLS